MTRLRRRGVIAGNALLIIAGLASAVAARSAITEPAALAATTTAATTAATTNAAVQGTDVSNLTTVTSWPEVRAAGMSFAGVMAFDGESVGNPSYQSQVTGALDAGLFVMPYVVGDPLKVATGGDQFSQRAWRVIDSVTGSPYQAGGRYLPITLDMESQPQVTSKECYGLSRPQMVNWISGFVAAAKAAAGLQPLIYSNPSWWQTCTGNTRAFAADPLWVADYNVSAPAIPPGWQGYTFWQSSDAATISGIEGEGDLDLDLMQGAPPAVTVGRGVSGSVALQTLNSLAGQRVSYAAAGRLPSYLSLTAAGLLRWSSSAPVGLHTVTVIPAGTAAVIPSSVTVTLRVHGAIALSGASRTSTAGTPVWLRVATSGPDQNAGFAPSLRAAGLPDGLSMTPAGVITGWPTRPGRYPVRVTAADALGGAGSASFIWTVKAAPDRHLH